MRSLSANAFRRPNLQTDSRMRIISAHPRNASRLARFARLAFLDAYGGADPAENVRQHVAEAFADEAIERDMHDADTTFLLAVDAATGDDADNILGYVKLCGKRPIEEIPEPAAMQLERIYVDQTRYSRGVGTGLIQAALVTAAEQGAPVIWLSVWKENRRAQEFYVRNGFSQAGETFFMMGPVREEDYIYSRRIS